MGKLRVTLLVFVAWTTSAWAGDCPRPDTLGTSRILEVDAAKYPRVGLKSFPQTLPLEDKEVVLTFDDGPAATTPRILAALARECVLATFFQVGRNSQALPGIVRKVAALGHTLGHHTWSHPHLNAMTFEAAKNNIDRGIAADEATLDGKTTTVPSTRFFRFPYFESTSELLAMLQDRGIVVFGADFWASDWLPMTPQEELKLITSRLKAARKGIILFHDTRAQTAAMLPDFLKFMRVNGYRVVHVIPKPKGADKHANADGVVPTISPADELRWHSSPDE
jgi:peptidoglycan/xylan/chitin deacetylase (PgdA/CDA1 family)